MKVNFKHCLSEDKINDQESSIQFAGRKWKTPLAHAVNSPNAIISMHSPLNQDRKIPGDKVPCRYNNYSDLQNNKY